LGALHLKKNTSNIQSYLNELNKEEKMKPKHKHHPESDNDNESFDDSN